MLDFADSYCTLFFAHMDPADTGSYGIFLTDAGSGGSHLICANNTFTNHAVRATSLNYSGSSSPILQIGNEIEGLLVSGSNGIQVNGANSSEGVYKASLRITKIQRIYRGRMVSFSD